MASAKRIIIGDSSTSEDWIPCIGETEYYAYIGGEKIPHWTTADTQPVSALTDDNAPSPYKVYYSSRYTSSYPAWRAFTNSIRTDGWASESGNRGSDAWLCLDLGEDKGMKNIKVTLWNRNNNIVNGPTKVTIYGSDSAPTNGSGSGSSLVIGTLPFNKTILGVFTGLDGTTKSKKAILDTIGSETSNATRSTSYLSNSANNYFRYIIIVFNEWSSSNTNKYCAVGRINIDGKKAT